MGLVAKDKGNGKDFDPVPQGVHRAICYGVYDLGTQFSAYYGKSAHKVLLQWELPDCRIDIEKDGDTQNLPRAQSKMYTLSLHEKSNLRKDLESWRGRMFTAQELEGFNLEKLLAAHCQLQIIHRKKEDKTYANVSLIIPAANGEKGEPENPTRFFSLNDHGMDIPEGTPEWIIKIIQESEEYKAQDDTPTGMDEPPWDDDAPPPDDDLDQIPF